MQKTKALPSTIFDHMLWHIQAADGSCRRAEIAHGECLLLFTSLDSVHAFLAACEDCDEQDLRPRIFSRNRKEFGQQARQSAREGVIGALFDPAPDSPEAPFLQFARVDR